MPSGFFQFSHTQFTHQSHISRYVWNSQLFNFSIWFLFRFFFYWISIIRIENTVLKLIMIELAIRWGEQNNWFDLIFCGMRRAGKESSSFQYPFSEFIQIASKRARNHANVSHLIYQFSCANTWVGSIPQSHKERRQKREQERQRNLFS